MITTWSMLPKQPNHSQAHETGAHPCRARRSILGAVGLAFALAGAGVGAQDFPVKPIRMIVTLSPGGTTDTVARVLAEQMGKILGQPVVVDNRPGANSTIGYGFVAKQAAPDGYTIALTVMQELAYLPLIVKELRFDPRKDLPPFIGVVEGRILLQSAARVPWNTFQEYVAYSKANPGKLNWGAATTSAMFPMLTLVQEAGLTQTYVPFSSSAQYIIGVLNGDLHVGMFGAASTATLGDKVKVLAITGTGRSAAYPNVPTFAELGFPNIQGTSFTLSAPVGVPKPILDKLAAAASKSLQVPDLRARFEKAGLEPQERSGEEVARQLEQVASSAAEIAKKGKVKPE